MDQSKCRAYHLRTRRENGTYGGKRVEDNLFMFSSPRRRVSKLLVDGPYRIHQACHVKYLKAKDIVSVAADVNIYVNSVNIVRSADVVSNDDKCDVLLVNVFSWERDCFLCSKQLNMKTRKGCMKTVSHVCKNTVRDNILAVCADSSDQMAMDVNSRVVSVSSLVDVGAHYHCECMVSFLSRRKTVLQES